MSAASGLSVEESSMIRRRTSSEHNESSFSEEQQRRRNKAAIQITRYMRSRFLMYSNFGPLVFCKASGSTAEFGTLYFDEKETKAKFISLADVTSAAMLGNFVEKYWKCSKPEILISVTGGAQTFDLTPWLKRAFEAGFVRAANDAKAWVVTGGTDAGVMELVATAMHQHNISLPVFGFTPLGCVNGRQKLAGCRNGTIHYAKRKVGRAGPKGAPLNPHHTHFVLVDSGKEAPQAWGTEIDLRYRFEEFYATAKHVPIVQVVVQGGPGTLDNILYAARKSCPIVLVAGSGGAASAVHRYCTAEEGLTDEDWQDELMIKFVKKQEIFEELLSLHEEHDKKLLNFFHPLGETDADGDDDMSAMLLKSIVKLIKVNHQRRIGREASVDAAEVTPSRGASEEVTPQREPSTQLKRQGTMHGLASPDEAVAPGEGERALMLAVKWDRPDVVRSIIDDDLKGGTIDFRRGHRAVVQAALELQRNEILTTLMKLPEWTVESVNLTPLYRCEDQYQYFRSDVPLQTAILEKHRDIYSPNRETSFKVYEDVVGAFLEKASPLAASYIRAGEYVLARPADLFFWATLAGIDDIMKKLWHKVDSPIVVALLGAHLCKGMAKQISWGRAEVGVRADELERWAIGVLDAIPKQSAAIRILNHQHGELWGNKEDNLLDLAMRTGAKSFLAHRYCTALMDLWWRGDAVLTTPTLDKDFSYLVLALMAVFPVHVLLDAELKKSERQSSREEGVGRYAPIRKEEVMDALAMTMKYSVYQHTCLVESKGKRAQSSVERSGSTHADLKRFYADNASKDKEDEAEEEREQPVSMLALKLTALASFYRVPAVKYVLRFMAHLFLLLLYGTVLVRSPNAMQVIDMAPLLPPIHWQEILFTIWVLGIGADEMHQYVVRKERNVENGGVLTSRFEGMIDFGQRLLVLGLVLRWAVLVAPTDDLSRLLYIGYQVVISLDVILITLELLSFLSVIPHFGVLVIMVTEMVQDMISFFQLFALVIMSFSLAFVGLSTTASVAPEDLETREEQMAGFGEGMADFGEALGIDLDGTPAPTPAATPVPSSLVEVASAIGTATRRALRAAGPSKTTPTPQPPGVSDEGEGEGNWYDTTGVVMMPAWAVFGDFDKEEMEADLPWMSWLVWIYVLISNVVLVNLLVAMFSDTYAKVKENSEIEYRYQQMQRIYSFAHVLHPMPPPLSMPELLFRAGVQKCKDCLRCSKPSNEKYERMPETRGARGRSRSLQGVTEVKRAELARKAVDSSTRLHMERYIRKEGEDDEEKLEFKVGEIRKNLEGLEDGRKDDRDLLKGELRKLSDELHARRGGRPPAPARRSSSNVRRASDGQPPSLKGDKQPPPLLSAESMDAVSPGGALAGARVSDAVAEVDFAPILARLTVMEERLAVPPPPPPPDLAPLVSRLGAMEERLGALDALTAQVRALSDTVNSPPAHASPPAPPPRASQPASPARTSPAAPPAPRTTVTSPSSRLPAANPGAMNAARAAARSAVSSAAVSASAPVTPRAGLGSEAPVPEDQPLNLGSARAKAVAASRTTGSSESLGSPRGGVGIADRIRKFSVPQPGDRVSGEL